MFMELWKQMPVGFRILWFVGVIMGATVTGLICTLLIKIITRL